jgi:hypothetical protein
MRQRCKASLLAHEAKLEGERGPPIPPFPEFGIPVLVLEKFGAGFENASRRWPLATSAIPRFADASRPYFEVRDGP